MTMAINDPSRYAEGAIERFAGTFIPFSSLLSSATREVDPVIRNAQTIMDQVKKKVPYFSTTIKPNRNIFAEEVLYPAGFGPDIASPFLTTDFRGHPVLDALKEDLVAIGTPRKQVFGLELNDDEHERYEILAGREVRDGLGRTYEKAMLAIIKRADREKRTVGPDSWRAAKFKEVTMKFRRKAKRTLLKEFPELKEEVKRLQRELRTKKGFRSMAPDVDREPEEVITVR